MQNHRGSKVMINGTHSNVALWATFVSIKWCLEKPPGDPMFSSSWRSLGIDSLVETLNLGTPTSQITCFKLNVVPKYTEILGLSAQNCWYVKDPTLSNLPGQMRPQCIPLGNSVRVFASKPSRTAGVLHVGEGSGRCWIKPLGQSLEPAALDKG